MQLSFKGKSLFCDKAYEFYNLLSSFGMNAVWLCSADRSKALRMVDAWFEGSIKWATCDATELNSKLENPAVIKERIGKALASLRQVGDYIPRTKRWYNLQEDIESLSNAIDDLNSTSIEVCIDGLITLFDELVICSSNSIQL